MIALLWARLGSCLGCTNWFDDRVAHYGTEVATWFADFGSFRTVITGPEVASSNRNTNRIFAAPLQAGRWDGRQ